MALTFTAQHASPVFVLTKGKTNMNPLESCVARREQRGERDSEIRHENK
jgi:hypothetical protein